MDKIMKIDKIADSHWWTWLRKLNYRKADSVWLTRKRQPITTWQLKFQWLIKMRHIQRTNQCTEYSKPLGGFC